MATLCLITRKKVNSKTATNAARINFLLRSLIATVCCPFYKLDPTFGQTIIVMSALSHYLYLPDLHKKNVRHDKKMCSNFFHTRRLFLAHFSLSRVFHPRSYVQFRTHNHRHRLLSSPSAESLAHFSLSIPSFSFSSSPLLKRSTPALRFTLGVDS